MYPQYDVILAVTSVIFSNIQKSSLIMRETADRFQLMSNKQNTWSVLLKTTKVVKNGKDLRNYHSLQKPTEMMIKCVMVSCGGFWHRIMGSLVAQSVKSLLAIQETWVQSLGGEDTLEKEMATHSNIFAWRIPWMSMVDYSPWDHKESDMTKWLTFTFNDLR